MSGNGDATRLEGRRIIVTGASTGIGKVTARELARLGADVTLVCRDAGRGAAARDEIEQATGRRPDLVLGDLSLLAGVRGVAAEIRRRYPVLHVLVNNAGLIVGDFEKTSEGLERTFATNHMAYFLLSTLLLDLLEKGAPARIVSVASGAHHLVRGRLDFDDLQAEKGYASMRAYSRSKLCNILFTRALARRVEGRGVVANCVHPGAIASNFGQSGTRFFAFIARLGRPFLLSVDSGARTQIWAASAPEAGEHNGAYFYKRKTAKTSRAARNEEDQERLWKLSEELAASLP